MFACPAFATILCRLRLRPSHLWRLLTTAACRVSRLCALLRQCPSRQWRFRDNEPLVEGSDSWLHLVRRFELPAARRLLTVAASSERQSHCVVRSAAHARARPMTTLNKIVLGGPSPSQPIGTIRLLARLVVAASRHIALTHGAAAQARLLSIRAPGRSVVCGTK